MLLFVSVAMVYFPCTKRNFKNEAIGNDSYFERTLTTEIFNISKSIFFPNFSLWNCKNVLTVCVSWIDKPNSDGNYTFPVDLAPIRIPVGARSIGKA